MKLKLLALVAGLLIFAATAHAQTNQWYRAGEIDFDLAPIVWLGAQGSPQYGVAFESRYWENAHTATGLEFGNNELGPGAYPGITYIATEQFYRFTPFASAPFWSRLSVGTFTGAEHWVNDGATGIPVGGIIDFAITRHTGIEVEGAEHFATQLQDSGLSLKADVQIKF